MTTITLAKIIIGILIIICLLWILSNMINHSMAKELQELRGSSKALVNGCDAFMKVLRLIRKNLNYTKLKDCPAEEINNIINESIEMINEVEKAYEGGQHGIHKQI